MEELRVIWQTYQEIGSLGVLAAFLIYVYIKRDKSEARQDDKEMSLIDVAKSLTSYLTASTDKLVGIDGNVNEIINMMTASDEKSQEHLTRIEERLNTLPEKVQEQLATAFNHMGERISELLTRTDDTNNEVRKLLTDWSTMATQLQGVLKKPISDEITSSAEKVRNKNEG